MKFRLYILLFLLLGLCRPAHAVLKEANLDNTLSILRQELTYYYQDQQEQAESSKLMRQMVFQELMSIVRRSNQNALMLYSQKSDYVFDLTYACHEATEMYHNFRRMLLPFRNIVDKYENEIARYDSLVTSLNTMSTRMLSEKAAIDRTVCLALAVNIKRTLEENRQSISDYIHYYHDTEERLKNLNDYASKRYYEIQNNIFINGGDNYFKILSQLGARLSQTKDAVSEKYEPYRHVRSQWDSRVIVLLFIIVIGYALLAIAINFVVLRFLLPKRLRTDTFMAKRTCIALASTVVTFAIILFIARLTTNHNFIIMASGLLMQYAWLLGVILISLLLRVDSTQIKSAFRIYMPLVIVGFIVITFRVVLIPNDLVNMVFPPILLVWLRI